MDRCRNQGGSEQQRTIRAGEEGKAEQVGKEEQERQEAGGRTGQGVTALR